jgi:glutamate racemase
MSGGSAPIGVFDSGVGGLSVWREIRHRSPEESIVYVADQAYVPYGPRPRDELRALTARITRFLLSQECKLVVVACNAASAAALHWLREQFPDTPFVGMEPAIKPAAASSKNRCVGVLATPATLEGELFLNTVAREASDLRIVAEPCPGLVARIESGALADDETRALLAGFLEPIREAGADTVVLACTHYPFVIDTIRALMGPAVNVIDPAPAVARQVARQLQAHALQAAAQTQRRDRFLSSGEPAGLQQALEALLGIEAVVEPFPATPS